MGCQGLQLSYTSYWTCLLQPESNYYILSLWLQPAVKVAAKQAAKASARDGQDYMSRLSVGRIIKLETCALITQLGHLIACDPVSS